VIGPANRRLRPRKAAATRSRPAARAGGLTTGRPVIACTISFTAADGGRARMIAGSPHSPESLVPAIGGRLRSGRRRVGCRVATGGDIHEMTRTQFTLYTALFGATAIVQPSAMAGVPGDWDWDGKKEDEKKCGDLKIEVEDIKVEEDEKKVTVEGELMCLDDKKDAKVIVKAKAIARVACEKDGNYPPGLQNRTAVVTVTGVQHIDESKIDPKSTDFKVVADDIQDFKSPCPPPFTAHIKELKAVKAVKVTVIQGSDAETTKCEVKSNGDFWCD
jgi:hypothetical protein